MKKIKLPERQAWHGLMQRPGISQVEMESVIKPIFEAVALEGNNAVQRLNSLYDRNDLPVKEMALEVISAASQLLTEELKAAIGMAAENIRSFHEMQVEKIVKIETMPGVTCWRESRPIETVGLYIPGGTAPLFSTVLMLGIPAKIAGCKKVILCTPVNSQGNIHPAILYAASLSGIDSLFGIGGAQAIAAMAIGTETVPKADKILGPGNQYVMAAKNLALQRGTAIDLPAGPSELLIIADKTCDPAFVAADLLSQAEHGADSQVMLLSDSDEVVERCLSELREQLTMLPRKNIAETALDKSKAILLGSIEDCISFSNDYAPEHLILATKDPGSKIKHIINAGSVFLGNFSCESAGDYASGTNHTLPTNGCAKSYSGVSLDSFIKKITFQELTPGGMQLIGPGIELMAEAEQLWGHKNAVSQRLKTLADV